MERVAIFFFYVIRILTLAYACTVDVIIDHHVSVNVRVECVWTGLSSQKRPSIYLIHFGSVDQSEEYFSENISFKCIRRQIGVTDAELSFSK